jgi:hypothetical protein
MKFKVKTGGKNLSVEFRFGSARDFRTLANWKATPLQRSNPLVEDALEYRSLAGKRWRSYSESRRTVASLASLKNEIAKNSKCEAVFILVAHARWHSLSPILGFCFCRRTWCHHIIIDFAAAHPNAIKFAGGQVSGVGGAMLYGVVSLARQLDAKIVWGEATQNSVEFYRSVLRRPGLMDHFFIQGKLMDYCARQYETVKIH